MPAKLEAALRARAEKLKRAGKLRDVDAYVYGTLRRTGWKPRSSTVKAGKPPAA